MNTRLFNVSALALLALAGSVHGQSCPPVSKFTQGAGAAVSDYFGQSVSMSIGGPGNSLLMVVGRPNMDVPGLDDNAGGFTVYHNPFGTWQVLYDAWNATGQGGEHLGHSISISDPYIIAGAPYYDGTNGRARIFRRGVGSGQYINPVNLTPSINPTGANFGKAVAISNYGGGWAVVGAPTHSFHGLTNPGAAFFYTRNADNTWTNSYTIWGGDFGGNSLDHRGTAVAMAELSEFAAVGSPDRELGGQPQNHGTVRIVHRLANGLPSGQGQEAAPPSPEADEHFGAAVAIESHLLVVGSPDEDMPFAEGGFLQQAIDGGAIYIFSYNTGASQWEFVSKLRSPAPINSGHFGAKVGTDGSTHIVVSEPGSKNVYTFVLNNGAWKSQAAIEDPDDGANGSFGSDVDVLGATVAIGDNLDDNNAVTNSGAVYTIDLPLSTTLGDSCSDPLGIPAGNYIGCTELATPSHGQVTTCGNGGDGQGKDVWFEFTPECDGNAIFDTFGSEFDTVLSVHSACPGIIGPDTTVVCNDDASFAAPNNRASLVTFNFSGGETYLVRVTGYNGAEGQFTLRHLYTYGVGNDTCATASSLGSSFGTYAFNSCSATTDTSLRSTCGNASGVMYHDVWFRWTAAQTRLVTMNTCGSVFDTVLAVYMGTQQNCPADAGVQVACSDDSYDVCDVGGSYQSSLNFLASAGQSYLIRVGGYTDAGGHGQVTIAPAPCRADVNLDGVVNSQDFFDFLSAFFIQAPGADMNGDSIINSQDYFDFLTAFFAGC